ncbi:hypothetical protein D3C79_872990 [compost metagenome]
MQECVVWVVEIRQVRPFERLPAITQRLSLDHVLAIGTPIVVRVIRVILVVVHRWQADQGIKRGQDRRLAKTGRCWGDGGLLEMANKIFGVRRASSTFALDRIPVMCFLHIVHPFTPYQVAVVVKTVLYRLRTWGVSVI